MYRYLLAFLLLSGSASAQTVGPIPLGQKGAAGGVAALDGNAKVPIGNVPTGLTSTTVPTGDLLAAESSTARANESAITTTQNLAAAGTAQSGATAVSAPTVYVVSGAANAGALLIPTIKNVKIINVTAVTILVYPPSNGTINGGAANAAVSIVAGGSARFGSVDGAAWFAG